MTKALKALIVTAIACLLVIGYGCSLTLKDSRFIFVGSNLVESNHGRRVIDVYCDRETGFEYAHVSRGTLTFLGTKCDPIGE